MTQAAALLCAVVSLCAVFSAAAQPLLAHGSVAVASVLTDRGLAFLLREPVLQAQGVVHAGPGWSGAVAIGAGIQRPDRGRLALRLGHRWALSNDWQADAALGHYRYAGPARARDFSHTEASLALGWRDVLSLSAASNHYPVWPGRRGGLQWAFDLGLRWPLARDWSVVASAGVADMPPLPSSRYRHSSTGVAWQRDAWRVALERSVTDAQARACLGAAAQSRWSVAVEKSFF